MPNLSASTESCKIFALIPCAGAGLRAGGDTPKQYQRVAGLPMVTHTLKVFTDLSLAGLVERSLVVVSPDDAYYRDVFEFASPHYCVSPCGGATRAQTVRQGLEVLLAEGATANDWVLVHDAARFWSCRRKFVCS